MGETFSDSNASRGGAADDGVEQNCRAVGETAGRAWTPSETTEGSFEVDATAFALGRSFCFENDWRPVVSFLAAVEAESSLDPCDVGSLAPCPFVVGAVPLMTRIVSSPTVSRSGTPLCAVVATSLLVGGRALSPVALLTAPSPFAPCPRTSRPPSPASPSPTGRPPSMASSVTAARSTTFPAGVFASIVRQNSAEAELNEESSWTRFVLFLFAAASSLSR